METERVLQTLRESTTEETSSSRKFSITKSLRPVDDRIPRMMKNIRRDRSEVCEKIASAIKGCTRGECPWPLFIFGSTGVGKTCALLSVADSFFRSYYTTIPHLNRDLIWAEKGDLVRNGYETSAPALWREIEEASVACVDELATRGTVTDAAYENLKNLCDLRENRATIFSSNVAPEKLLEIYDKRILSRIVCGTVVSVTGKDRRFAR